MLAAAEGVIRSVRMVTCKPVKGLAGAPFLVEYRIEVDADSASFSMTIENIPSENPRTGRITCAAFASMSRRTSDTRHVVNGCSGKRKTSYL